MTYSDLCLFNSNTKNYKEALKGKTDVSFLQALKWKTDTQTNYCRQQQSSSLKNDPRPLCHGGLAMPVNSLRETVVC